MKIYTPVGTNETATRKDLEEALEALQRGTDPTSFVGVERDDGSFVQMTRLPIEYRGPEWQMPRRASVPPGIRAMFQEFAEGSKDWDRGVEWIQDPPTPPLRWWQDLPWWVQILPYVAFIGLYVFLLQCSG